MERWACPARCERLLTCRGEVWTAIGRNYRLFYYCKHQTFRRCVNAFRMGRSTSSFTTKSCTFALVAFLTGIPLYSLDSIFIFLCVFFLDILPYQSHRLWWISVLCSTVNNQPPSNYTCIVQTLRSRHTCNIKKKKLRGLSPRANYTDRAATAGRRI